MPRLGADMTAGTLISWLKKTGERVARGDIIAEVDTDKGVIEVEVFTSGVLEKVLVQPGEEVPVGTPMAIIREEGTPGETSISSEATAIAATLPAQPAPPPAAPHAPLVTEAATHLRASPAAKKLASALGVDLAAVKGTGPAGRIQREDVERVAHEQRGEPQQIEAEPDRHARLRRTIAAAMARSKREIPHYYLSTTIDMQKAVEWLAEENTKHPLADRLLYSVLLIKAVALALHEVPELNSIWKDGQAVRSEAIHVGFALSLKSRGLVAPALHNADRQSLTELMKNFRDLVNRTRGGALRSSELSDATITITSLGEMGVETVFGIIYPPQVALVGFGKVLERPVAVGGQIISRQVINATLSADHRVTDGNLGSLFLATVERLLQEPEKL